MSIDDEIKELMDRAAALKQMGKAEKALEAATEAHRAAPTEATRAAYRKANEAMAEARAASRVDRSGAGVGGDAFRVDEGSEG